MLATRLLGSLLKMKMNDKHYCTREEYLKMDKEHRQKYNSVYELVGNDLELRCYILKSETKNFIIPKQYMILNIEKA